MMNKKGDIFQLFFLLIFLFMAAIIGLLTYAMSDEINETLLNFSESGTTAYEATNIIRTNVPTAFDELVLFLFLGGVIALCISAVKTNFSPTIIFLFIIITILAVAVAGGFVNIYQGFTDAPALNDLADNLTFTNIIFSRYTPLIICIVSALILILMYGKTGSDIVS